MRWLLGLLLLPACSFFNAVDEGRIRVELCDDGVDNDADGELDCRDLDCFGAPACAGEDRLDTCTDGRDNDRNGRVDCEEPACQGFAPCLESGAACGDGLDNDQDGHTDCDDERCALLAGCFTRSHLVRAPLCPALRKGFALLDDFDTLDTDTWEVFSTGAFDRPRATGGALDPHGIDNFWSSGLVTKAQIGLGAAQAFQLDLDVRADAGCDGPPGISPCGLSASFDTREVWGDSLPFGQALLVLYAHILPDSDGAGPVLAVEAFYHVDNPPVVTGLVRLPWSPGQVYRLSMVHSADSREVVFTADEEELARVELLEREPLGRLVIQNQLDRSFTPGAMLVERVELQVAEEEPAPGCAGRITGQPLLPPTACDPSSTSNTGTFNPRVLRAADGGYLLFYGASEQVNRRSVALARSADGTRFEDLTPPRASLEPENLLYPADRFEVDEAAGALFNAAAGRYEAWYSTVGSSEGPRNFHCTAPMDDPTAWSRGQELVLQDPAPKGPLGGRHAAGVIAAARMLHLGDRYLGFYSAPAEDGRRSVFALESDDGVHFRALSEDPVLRPTQGSFDADGIRSVSAALHDGGIALAYVGAAFGQPQRLGLAYSTDGGRSFVKHQDNPLTEPTPGHLDAQGIEGVSLLIEGRTLRVWYQGSLGAFDCPLDQLDIPSYGAFGLLELTPADR